MDPPSKRRRLAPKVSDAPAQSAVPSTSPPQPQPQAQAQVQAQGQPSAQSFPQDQQHFPPAEPLVSPAQQAAQSAPLTERGEFEAYARHLQDAAMYIKMVKEQLVPHRSVSVLMLRWEEDLSVEADMLLLEKVFRDRYNYSTEKWVIPTVPNPSIKLSYQMASFLENAGPDHLLIVYYAGHGFVGQDNHLYWACNARDDAAKLKWDGVRCLFEDAQPEILLLLDTCAIKDSPPAGSHGTKQAIAAHTPEQSSREAGPRSFTATLADALTKLASGRPFSVQKLLDEIIILRQHESAQAIAKMVNGTAKLASPERVPVTFTLTPAKGRDIVLGPLKKEVAQLQSPPQSADVDGDAWRSTRDDQPLSATEVADLTFEESSRVLVCTTFVGDASADMGFFHQWLHNLPSVASKITVEGMFLGPPTMLLISMPLSIWNIVQHDKVCCFLGYISSHNMIHLYQRLVKSAANGQPMTKDFEDGRILLEAREAAAVSPSLNRRDHTSHYSSLTQENQPRQEHRVPLPTPNGAVPVAPGPPVQTPGPKAKDDAEDSDEMKEAAEQLKMLSDVHAQSNRVGDSIAVRHPEEPDASFEVNDAVMDEIHYGGVPYSTPRAKIGGVNGKIPSESPRITTGRRPLQKQVSKQETRCSHCSHAPFKDSSSLRKHIAAAHTRPFPCAFSFAGCASTFGSKNEWKRHIASQHLCLQYYRCSACPQSSADGKGNEFNRKDLFTQHLRRMHAPPILKKPGSKPEAGLLAEWEAHVKEMQASCLVTRRQPPQRSSCPKPDCKSVFEGAGSWDEWTEHVGRHMEKGEADRTGVDPLLAQWALDEGIIERIEDDTYRLCPQNGSAMPADRNANPNSTAAESTKKEDEDPSITVALSAPDSDGMDVD
ncbi:hypothetical protein QR685DRAFT_87048 [Neurospora intermedia]|uniref:C2H2-type domain-containing protein n=1 Tax=Neurospora intermedia TaxID=5142 RepID=A0ABR3D222_NEUIN